MAWIWRRSLLRLVRGDGKGERIFTTTEYAMPCGDALLVEGLAY